MAQEMKTRRSSASIVAAAWACIGSLLVVANDAVAEKLRVGVNLTTIETLPIYLSKRSLRAKALSSPGALFHH